MADAATAQASAPPLPASRSLTVLYDERCRFCRRCRDWLLTQRCHLPVELMPAGSEESLRRFGSVPWLRNELVVVDDAGRVWAGPAAFLVCLWATARYRPWAYLLARPQLASHTSRFFRFVSARRDRWSTWFGKDDPDCSWCDELRRDWGEG
jgi:predicted DCC family thiol-disulfide oxidoreductase YuxK